MRGDRYKIIFIFCKIIIDWQANEDHNNKRWWVTGVKGEGEIHRVNLEGIVLAQAAWLISRMVSIRLSLSLINWLVVLASSIALSARSNVVLGTADAKALLQLARESR